MRYRKIQLISPPSNRTIEGQQKWARWPQPLGLLSIATYVNQHLPEAEFEILDFDCVLDLRNPRAAARIGSCDLVGLSLTFAQVDEGLAIAKAAKDGGAHVVIGGNISTSIGDRLLKYHPYVDYCICYDGEEAMLQLISGTQLAGVPNLIYREGDSIAKNQIKQMDLRTIPIPDRQYIEFEKYLERTADPDFRPMPQFSRPTNMYSLKGCSWRAQEEGGCFFCSIHDAGLRTRDPRQVWEERQQLVGKYGVNFIWDPSDNFAADWNWFETFHHTRPEGFRVAFGNYIRIDCVNEKSARMLQDMGSVQVFMGMESGDDNSLKAHNKGITRDRVEDALRILHDHQITAVLGLVIGAVGETQESIIETIHFMKHLLAKHENLDRFEWGTLAPLPGSKAFNAIMNHPELSEKYRNFGEGNIMSSLEQMVEDWPEYMCDESVDFEYLLYMQQVAQEHLPYQMTRYQKRAWTGTAHKAFLNGVIVRRDAEEGRGPGGEGMGTATDRPALFC